MRLLSRGWTASIRERRGHSMGLATSLLASWQVCHSHRLLEILNLFHVNKNSPSHSLSPGRAPPSPYLYLAVQQEFVRELRWSLFELTARRTTTIHLAAASLGRQSKLFEDIFPRL